MIEQTSFELNQELLARKPGDRNRPLLGMLGAGDVGWRIYLLAC